MPFKKLSKEENQPTIKEVLPYCTKEVNINRTSSVESAKSIKTDNLGAKVSPTTAELHDWEFVEVETRKKRKRRNRSSGSLKTNPNKKVNMEDPIAAYNNEHITPTPPESQTPLVSIPEVTLSPELLELERRLNKNMIINIASGIKSALKPLQESIKNIEKSSDLIIRQETRIKELTEENTSLHEEVKKVKIELIEFKERLFNLENKSLECNLIFRGVDEAVNETNDGLKERIYWLLADTVNNPNASEPLAAAKCLGICKCRRLGKINPVRPRPISVEFDTKSDANTVYNHRFYLTNGVFVDREFNLETEKCRRTLRPILHAAKQKPEFCYKSSMDGSKLVIDGKRYSVSELDKLPQKLSPFEVMTKSNDDTIGFFRELCPFSNFHPVAFIHNGQSYHSGKQLIQHQKALHCNDSRAADRILATKTAIACKQLSYTIQNYDQQSWTMVAKDRCLDGLKAKFVQNPELLQVLLSTGSKLIVECSKDHIWDTGIPLYRWDCLHRKYWSGNGLLSELLMEIRDSCKETTEMDIQNSLT